MDFWQSRERNYARHCTVFHATSRRVETAKHRFFVFLDRRRSSGPKIVAYCGWTMRTFSGFSRREFMLLGPCDAVAPLKIVRVTTRPFALQPFPFPDCTDAQKSRIRDTWRAARRASQAAAGVAPEAHAHRHVQRAGEAAGRGGTDGQRQGDSRAGAGVGVAADPRRPGRRGIRRLRLARHALPTTKSWSAWWP